MNSTTLRHNVKLLGIGIVVGIFIAACVCSWLQFKPPTLAVLAPASPKLSGATTVTKACTTVRTYQDSVKKKLGLPDPIKKDSQASVIAAAAIPPSDYPRTATSVLHLDTGVGEIYLQQDSLPWVAFNRRATIGVTYGIKDDSTGFITNLYGKLELAQIKKLSLGIYGDVDNSGDWYLGGFIESRFQLH